ncbi:unnamed protein product [Oppiella nova]|uniref:RING-type domain-containing protein n=1 Tax=Oppiella nova TaxID=334625 RepID=A0A7R9QUF5_9ACAR|nr:unnamed protein product [Oppiella nova]CAG2175304.1 unnamed protein product [Oppiella nova]
MSSNNTFGVNCSQPSHRSSNSGINFDFPSLNLDLSSITEALSPRSLSNGWDQLMASTKTCANRPKDITCQSCGLKFSVFKRKRTCFDCNMDFCTQCLNKEVGYDRKNHCKRCVVFNAVPLDRNALNGLRARDLKWFLASKRIPSQMCKEKGELVDLILQSFSPQTNTSESGEYMRRFDNYNTTTTHTSSDNQSPSDSQPESRNERHSPIYPTLNPLTSDTSATNGALPGSSESVNEKPESTPVKAQTYFNIDDLTSLDQLKELSVKQMKLILTRNFIDYKGCVEKEELFSKVERLWTDKQENKMQNVDDIPDSNVCKICMESTIDCVLLECGHMISCTNCGKRLSECPICRQYVSRVVHIFKS